MAPKRSAERPPSLVSASVLTPSIPSQMLNGGLPGLESALYFHFEGNMPDDSDTISAAGLDYRVKAGRA